MDLFSDLPEPDHNDHIKGHAASLSSTKEPCLTPVPLKTNAETVGDKRKCKNAIENTEIEEKQRKKDSEEFGFSLKGYVADRQGEREDMQDAHVIINDFLQEIPGVHKSIHRLALYAVFDGHGGVRASRFASQHLHNNLRDKFPKGDVTQVEKEIRKILIEAFKKTDEDFLKEATKNKPSWKDGTTAVVVLAINDTLYIANLGDSKAVLCRYKEDLKKCVGIPLTTDHSPSLYEERMRIQKAGGSVRDGRVLGVLEVARSIGDGPYKNHGVTCVPDVKRCQLTENDRYLMIACDGLWKSYSIDESIQYVNKILEDKSIQASGKKSEEDVKFDTVCNKLANAAVLRLSGDNVTVVVVAIHPNK
ncbi:integrin-linked kinase-associated serine/threonine phosphatase 2C [Biomphalaria pfeifferi]|uniref:Integrin-linked kinase-associated serine/threonine phosphatase 2C n=1 Tax=Biomphalaria pfeifferi TaxID=112525 RepID=A0AAD8BLE0_BIOPF|nr:integrin-linked kinase-associated serine/threonine phosphatase 2C [Biomphalaria pfeifferi]